jgi:hypothetical protein
MVLTTVLTPLSIVTADASGVPSKNVRVNAIEVSLKKT